MGLNPMGLSNMCTHHRHLLGLEVRDAKATPLHERLHQQATASSIEMVLPREMGLFCQRCANLIIPNIGYS